ncbi:MAG TPA: hypothetical protein VK622_10155 [Puia sp.]|nr:hypothetical protein [Puia sp.]
MQHIALTRQELLALLEEQLYFLDNALSNFSLHKMIEKCNNKVIGKPVNVSVSTEVEAKRIAVIIRVLVHDTANSTSLLKYLNIIDNIEFIDSSLPDDGKLHSMTGMHGVRGVNPDQYFGLVGKINSNGSLISVPLFEQHLPEWFESYKKVDFQKWWQESIICTDGHSHSRREIVLNMANKDGGAHVDNLLPEKYTKTKDTALTLNIEGVKTDLERNVVYASVAQIGWELINSIDHPIV